MERRLIKAVSIDYIDWEIDSVGGVDLSINFTNNSIKQISYIHFTVKFYDRMGHIARCEIRDCSVIKLKVTGPINAGISKNSHWSTVIYNSALGAIQPQKIEIDFTNGSTETIICSGKYWTSKTYYGGVLHD